MKKVRRNVLLSGVSMAANFALPLLALPFLTSSLGTEAFGRLAIAQSVTIVLCLVVDFGFILVAARQVAVAEGCENVNNIYSRTQNARVLLAIVSFSILMVLQFTEVLPISSTLLFATTLPAIFGSVLQATWFFQGKAYFGWLALANVISKFCYLLVAIFAVRSSADLPLAGLAFAMSYVVGGVILFLAARRSGVRWFFSMSINDSTAVIGNSLRAFLSLSLLSFHTQIIITLTGIFVGPAAAGTLLVTDRVIRSVAAVGNPIVSALFPTFSKLYSEGGDGVHNLRRQVLGVLLSVSLIGSTGLFFGADYIASFMMADNISELAFLIRLTSLIPLFAAIGVVYGGLTLIPAGRDGNYLLAIIVAEVTSFIVFFVMLTVAADLAGVAGILAAELLLAVCMYAAVQLYLKR